MKNIRIMTFNIRHALGLDGEVKLERIAAEIEASDADIVGLQEVDRFLPRSFLENQPVQLGQLLNMHSCYSPSEDRNNSSQMALNIRKYDANTGLNGQYGTAILSRFPITSYQFAYLPGNNERRSLLQAKVEIGGNEITILNTHLGRVNDEQTLQVDALVEALSKVEGKYVLMGDFNIQPQNPLFRKLASHTRKVLLREKVTTRNKGEGIIIEIDHIFTNMKPQCGAWTQPTEASDHHPVLAEVSTL